MLPGFAGVGVIVTATRAGRSLVKAGDDVPSVAVPIFEAAMQLRHLHAE